MDYQEKARKQWIARIGRKESPVWWIVGAALFAWLLLFSGQARAAQHGEQAYCYITPKDKILMVLTLRTPIKLEDGTTGYLSFAYGKWGPEPIRGVWTMPTPQIVNVLWLPKGEKPIHNVFHSKDFKNCVD